MSTSAFAKDTSFNIDGKNYRLVRQVEGETWQAEDSRTKRIVELSVEQLQTKYLEGTLTFVSTEATRTREVSKYSLPIDYPEQAWETAKVRRHYVLAIIDIPNTRDRLVPVIRETWEKLKLPATAPNPSTVVKWKKRFLQSGKDVRALISQTSRKGNKSARYTSAVELLVDAAIEKKYMCRERGTFQSVLDHALALVLRENQLRPENSQLQMPSLRLVKRKIHAIPAFDRFAARYGRTAATKRFRAVQAHRLTSAPLDRAETDHSQLDLMALDDQSGLPLGRPWLTICVDDFSRCVLGIYVGFEPPSHASVARCLKHAFLPKVNFRKEYPAIVNEWAAHGVMRELVVDNGVEFHSVSLENACYTLGIEIHYSARKTPWFKGKVERFIGTLNRAIAHRSPGTTFGDIFEKDEYDPVKHAVIRFSVLLEIVNTWVADVYHQQIHSSLGAPPAVVWANSIAAEDILVPDDPTFLDAILGQSETRQLSHKGIELYGLLYNSHELMALRRKLGEQLNVEVRVDTANLGKIVVLAPDKREMFVAKALNAEYAAGLSLWQHKVCKRFAARQMESYDSSGWIEAKARISELIDDELTHKKQSTRARIARYKGDAKLLAKDKTDAPDEKKAKAPAVEPAAVHVPAVPVAASAQPTPATDTAGPPWGAKPLAAESAPTPEPATPKRKFKPVYRPRVLTLEETEEASDD